MVSSFPSRPNLEWLRKTAKQRLAELRASDPKAKLADAQLNLARQYGFASWRKLKTHVEAVAAAPEAPTADQVVQAFFRLVGHGELERVRAALDVAPQFVNAVGPHPFWGGRPQALHVSIESDRAEIFALLLERGAEVNGRNDQYDHWSPLMLAIQRNREVMRDELLRRGAHVNLPAALMMGDDPQVEAMLKEKGIAGVVPSGGSLLSFARTTRAIDLLLEQGALIEQRDHWNSAPIDAFSRLGKRGLPLVAHLIARGASASPAEYARLGDLSTLASMLEADPSIVNTPEVLLGAVEFGHHEVVEWLLSRGADVNTRRVDKSRQTPLHEAAWNGDLRMAQLLMAAGADPALLDGEHQSTPLHWAETALEMTNNPRCAEVGAYLKDAAQ